MERTNSLTHPLGRTIISVLNQKGGAGKTTTVVNLADALARRGYEIVVIDMDPQGNLSDTLGTRSKNDVNWNTSGLFSAADPGKIPPTPWYETVADKVFLIYGHISLTKIERFLMAKAMPGFDLSKLIDRMALSDEHIVLIDCPPSLSVLTVNALVASDYCLIPLESGSQYSLDGYEDLTELIVDVQGVNAKLKTLGLLLNRHDGRRTAHKGMEAAMRKRFGDLVFQTCIPSSARLQDCRLEHKTIFDLDRKGSAAEAFMALADEVLGRMGLGTEPQIAEYAEELGNVQGNEA